MTRATEPPAGARRGQDAMDYVLIRDDIAGRHVIGRFDSCEAAMKRARIRPARWMDYDYGIWFVTRGWVDWWIYRMATVLTPGAAPERGDE